MKVSEELSSVETSVASAHVPSITRVSEELSSVETVSFSQSYSLVASVSEELSSVETTPWVSRQRSSSRRFQKNLVVWKLCYAYRCEEGASICFRRT